MGRHATIKPIHAIVKLTAANSNVELPLSYCLKCTALVRKDYLDTWKVSTVFGPFSL